MTNGSTERKIPVDMQEKAIALVDGLLHNPAPQMTHSRKYAIFTVNLIIFVSLQGPQYRGDPQRALSRNLGNRSHCQKLCLRVIRNLLSTAVDATVGTIRGTLFSRVIYFPRCALSAHILAQNRHHRIPSKHRRYVLVPEALHAPPFPESSRFAFGRDVWVLGGSLGDEQLQSMSDHGLGEPGWEGYSRAKSSCSPV